MASGEDGCSAGVEGGVVTLMVVFVGVMEYGVSVEMLFVAMSVVALCTKITIVKEKRLSEDRSPSNHT